MSISSSLNAGVMGLNVNATRLSTISDNIANSSTSGYKRSQVDFSSMVINQSSGSYAAGGVRVNTFKDIASTGSLISTGNSTDIAVSGRGLFPVTDQSGLNATPSDRNMMLLPTGGFFADENGNLRTQSGLFLLGWPADASGQIGNVSRNSGINLQPVNVSQVQSTATPTTTVGLGINLPADATVAGAAANDYNLPIEYFDSLGRANSLTLQFTPTVPGSGASNAWHVEVFDSAGDPAVSIGNMDLTFNGTGASAGRINTASAGGGATYDAATGIMSLTLPHGPVEVFVGRPNDTTGITQLASSFSPTAVTKDGAPIGKLAGVEIDDNGFMQAVYDTGQRRTMYQIPVGDVPNMNGLTARDAQAFSVSAASGSLYLWDAGTGPVGGISGYSLMESTTDIAAELTDLIETQRAYSSNAKIVQTVDEMLQETTNLKR
ncbi:flagellar hook protein FlgE [Hyphomonas johnsonii]|jgi:flagellar hook protein FlgE|uniref:Flagellar hook protein FlgE n=1 Tax=Hyphomonas johnsonii MHS-2 TaxID=1280950 RepID=A0A059FNL6_9PROT|nr:flagellar hook-basal body complex protein [Hyphomonas johnsonii]KCZ92217.1 flagellar hook protein FlgE [Hyphomonas johnsonii MHS-2]